MEVLKYIPYSKSLLNRSYLLEVALTGSLTTPCLSQSMDVKEMYSCFQDFLSQKDILYIGNGGTSLRFFAVFCTLHPGVYKIKMDTALSKRPHNALVELFDQLNVKSNFVGENLEIDSRSAIWPHKIVLNLDETTQVASACLILASVTEKFPKQIYFTGGENEAPYLEMTSKWLEKIGFSFSKQEQKIYTLGYDKDKFDYKKFLDCLEKDASVLWSSLALCYAKNKEAKFQFDFDTSVQPEARGFDIFTQLNLLKAEGAFVPSDLSLFDVVKNQKTLWFDFEKYPDLFLVGLGFFIVLGEKVTIKFPSRLEYKESKRLSEALTVLDRLQVPYVLRGRELELEKIDLNLKKLEIQALANEKKLEFSGDSDHRLVMLFHLLKLKGLPLIISDEQSVYKSFPLFFDFIKKLNKVKI